MNSPVVRAFADGDLDALYDVALRTGADGDDASALYDDGRLVGHVWAAPYARFAPEHAFVVEDDAGVGGYVLGAVDSRAFEATLEAEWWPDLRAQYPDGSGGQERDQLAIALIHRPSTAPRHFVTDYPSHLHIDLLPRLQKRGLGRALLDQLLTSLRHAGSTGVHLGTSTKNENAVAFYRHVGFDELFASKHGVLFGRRLT